MIFGWGLLRMGFARLRRKGKRMPKSTDPLAVFGTTLRKLRLRRGLTQQGLAELAGIHRNYEQGIENGHRNLGLKNICKLAAALEVRPGALFKEF
jgi:DNA-binding XRE family transcriptional regulator